MHLLLVYLVTPNAYIPLNLTVVERDNNLETYVISGYFILFHNSLHW